MSLENARMPSLKDKHREITNQELAAKTEQLKKETMTDEKVVKTKSKSK